MLIIIICHFTHKIPNEKLFPLNGGRRLRCDIVYDTIHALHAVTYLVGHVRQELGVELVPVRGHAYKQESC